MSALATSLARAASPPCRTCEQPISRLEQAWHYDEDGAWRCRFILVCPSNHRHVVEPIA